MKHLLLMIVFPLFVSGQRSLCFESARSISGPGVHCNFTFYSTEINYKILSAVNKIILKNEYWKMRIVDSKSNLEVNAIDSNTTIIVYKEVRSYDTKIVLNKKKINKRISTNKEKNENLKGDKLFEFLIDGKLER